MLGGDVATTAADITGLLKKWSTGDERARDELVAVVYEHLHRLAHRRLQGAPAEQSLNTTGLVHETYLRLVEVTGPDLTGRAHFFALASRVMRNLLVDRARGRLAVKRGSGVAPVEFKDALVMSEEQVDRVIQLDDALRLLETVSPRQSELLQQHYFGGLTLEESAEAVGVSVATAKRDLRTARAWLALELSEKLPPS